MSKYIDENGKTVNAKNYREAAVKLYGQSKGYRGTEDTTYAHVHNGYAEVRVYKTGDKIGTYWGIRAATPRKHTLKRVK